MQYRYKNIFSKNAKKVLTFILFGVILALQEQSKQKSSCGKEEQKMTNMVTEYEKYSKAHSYILGFERKGNLYAVKMGFEELAMSIRYTVSSRGNEQARIYISSENRKAYIASGRAVIIAKAEELEADSKHNKGDNFERIVSESYGIAWTGKNSVPFWVAGDINVNGEEIQIKLQGGELTNSRAIESAQLAC